MSHAAKPPSSATTPSAYTAFNSVDELVAKNVVGSDGADKWQKFRQQTKVASSAVAPTAPLKAIDRAVGFTSWKEERAHADSIRANDGPAATEAGVYTHFKKQTASADGLTKKDRHRIESRLIGKEQAYFIAVTDKQFEGYKFDYVFTTKESHGTGYYFDGMDSLKKLRGELTDSDIAAYTRGAAKHTKAPLDATDATDTTHALTEQPPTDALPSTVPSTRKPKRQKTTVTMVETPNHPLDQVAAALALRHETTLRLPLGWESAVSLNGPTYYYNRTTGERTWTRPTNVTHEPLSGASMTAAVEMMPQGSTSEWKTATDPTSGKEYYYHTVTGETVWEKPT